ncbi:MAG: gliding motility-associated ABC transporter permease subunit GldF, partial [Bacteroidota bacterium]
MKALYIKELRAFLSSLIGYIVIGIFLVVNSLFLFVFTNSLNILDAQYSTLDNFFYIAPWLFLFLIPAITMRSFSEEQREGTLELLLTKPVSEFEIVLAKFFACLTLVSFSLLPTLIYFFSVYSLGDPVGNIDTGATWGSYLGLFFVASIFVSLGIFTSSLTNNQIVSFLLSALGSYILYNGFQSLGTFDLLGTFDKFIISLGIEEHYRGLSVGLIDSRDVLYFLGVSVMF